MKIDPEYQEKVTRYYDRFSKVYDLISSDSYYHAPRLFAIDSLDLKSDHTTLNIPCGTGQNFTYIQNKLGGTGQLIGIDLSQGMLSKAQEKIHKNSWGNIQVLLGDATKIKSEWMINQLGKDVKFDSILCDLGLSGFPEWQNIIDNLISLLKTNGKLVIMDWYIEKPSLRASFITWIGKGEVNRPLYQYMEGKMVNFKVNKSFKNGDMFVAVGTKKD